MALHGPAEWRQIIGGNLDLLDAHRFKSSKMKLFFIPLHMPSSNGIWWSLAVTGHWMTVGHLRSNKYRGSEDGDIWTAYSDKTPELFDQLERRPGEDCPPFESNGLTRTATDAIGSMAFKSSN